MLSTLKNLLSTILPLLEKNHNLAHQEWMDGTLPHGALQYIVQRYQIACAVLQRTDLTEEQSFEGCAMITIDLRTIVKENPKEADKLQDWLQCFANAGYTDNHHLFNFPIKP